MKRNHHTDHHHNDDHDMQRRDARFHHDPSHDGPQGRGRGHGFGGFGPGFGPGFGRGFEGRGRASKGDVRSAILSLLSEGSSNGYGLIKAIAEKTGGAWRPSPGSVYPTLQQLVDEELIEATGFGRRSGQNSCEGILSGLLAQLCIGSIGYQRPGQTGRLKRYLQK